MGQAWEGANVGQGRVRLESKHTDGVDKGTLDRDEKKLQHKPRYMPSRTQQAPGSSGHGKRREHSWKPGRGMTRMRIREGT